MTRRTEDRPADFLPMSREEMDARGWDALDVLIVTGDAYVDHPSFGAALLGRWLESHGFRVGIVSQPQWDSATDFAMMGAPRLFVGVTAGALDSMVAHYTAFRKPRHDDAYTPGGRHGARPNRATLVYAQRVREAFSDVPIVIGGIEASLRRATHYDFWSDKLRRSILVDSQADLLVYGMAERAVLGIARRLRDGRSLLGTGGTAWYSSRSKRNDCELPDSLPPPCHSELPTQSGSEESGQEPRRMSEHAGPDPSNRPEESGLAQDDSAQMMRLPSHEEIEVDATKLMDATLALERQVHSGDAWATQTVAGRTVTFAPPAAPLSTKELDALYALPFTRKAHPSYDEPVPALEMIQFSVTSHRGCGGGCSFCSLALHQGRRIASRSRESIVEEVKGLARHEDFKGAITDVGGPTANMWGATCIANASTCTRQSCLYPAICPSFRDDQQAVAELLQAAAEVRGVKSVRVASGVRHDLAMRDANYVKALVGEFTGGQLKLAPEHNCDHVLKLMRKPGWSAFERFLTIFQRTSRSHGKEQYIIPYLISAFPGCTDADMRRLAGKLKSMGWRPQQVQCFIPTPGTVATAMFYAGIDPEGHPIPVARTDAQRRRQHRILQPGVGRPR